MTSVGVKGVSTLFDASVSAKNGVQSDNHTESFNETFNSMRAEKSDAGKDFDEVGTKRSDDNQTARIENAGRKNQVKPEEEVTEEQMAAMSDEVASQIKEILMDKYNISEEELNVIIDSLGMKDENLLNVTALTQIVMKLEGVENQADMLTNPDFAKNLKDILSKAEEIKMNVKPEDFNIEKMMAEESKVEENEETSQLMDEMMTADVVEEATEDETTTDMDGMVEEMQMSEQMMAENASNGKDSGSDGLLKHDDSDKNAVEAKNANENLAVQPQDFAQKLTEDLSEKVGETKANDIVRQVVEQTQLHVKQGVTSLEMQLYPEHLGKVLVQVVSNDGNITAQITAESEAAKNALESQLTLLKDNLNNQGIKVENVEVTIASHAFEQNMQGERNGEQNSSQSKRGRRTTGMFFDEVSDEQVEENEQGIMELKGSTVSYSA